MTKKKTDTSVSIDDPTVPKPLQAGPTQIMVHGQYIKDLSFENPLSPDRQPPANTAPHMDVNIAMNAERHENEKFDALYEVTLEVTATAKRNDATLFLAQISYGVLVSLHEVPEENHHALLLIEIPKLAFPYVRQLISDLTGQAGYPPLLLNPIDFNALYKDRFAAEMAEQETLKKAPAKGTA